MNDPLYSWAPKIVLKSPKKHHGIGNWFWTVSIFVVICSQFILCNIIFLCNFETLDIKRPQCLVDDKGTIGVHEYLMKAGLLCKFDLYFKVYFPKSIMWQRLLPRMEPDKVQHHYLTRTVDIQTKTIVFIFPWNFKANLDFTCEIAFIFPSIEKTRSSI
jgi:hypothetical protein